MARRSGIPGSFAWRATSVALASYDHAADRESLLALAVPVAPQSGVLSCLTHDLLRPPPPGPVALAHALREPPQPGRPLDVDAPGCQHRDA